MAYSIVQYVTASRSGSYPEDYFQGGMSSANGSTTLTPTAGNSLLAVAMWFASSDDAASWSDELGGNDGWTNIGELYDAGSQTQMAAAVLHNAAATSTQVRVSFAGAANHDYPTMVVIEISGLANVAALDWKMAFQSSIGTSADAITTGNMGTLSTQPAAVIGVSWDADGIVDPPNPGTGYTDGGDIGAYSGTSYTGNWQHKRVTSTAATAATWTNPAGTNNFASFVVALQESGGGATGQPAMARHHGTPGMSKGASFGRGW